ncbi:hypothetical protein [Catenuloplanes indicus]|uniref:Uncharacterized protein n=1 Tax=Catenuloplanes indicus TaxID=137267 RepID=A0AAE4AVQ8_9ACTN|nr:hypothetical protein [Catenuloplanes indicus]MDQ0365160.1 hypothetical protein [Catenuloplanes indicus]
MRGMGRGRTRPSRTGTGRPWPVASVLLIAPGSWAGRPASHPRRDTGRTRTVLV